MINTHHEVRMTNDGEDRNGLRQELSFSKVLGSEIVEILQNRCCSMDFLQETDFNHLVKAN